MYNEDDYLMISGLQHFSFCRRQWALIHIEQLWADNLRTVEGNILHERAHDESFTESRGDTFIVRGLRVSSPRLGLSGACDVVEFHKNRDGIPINGHEGSWIPYPIEYKRGIPKENNADLLQLCAQAICLEEMLCCEIAEGALYYGETRRRTRVTFTPQLRQEVEKDAAEMHELYRRGYTPRVKMSKSCNACSLKEMCLPKMPKPGSVSDYIRRSMEETP